MNRFFTVIISLTVILGLCAGYLMTARVESSVKTGIELARSLKESLNQREKEISELNNRLSEFIVGYKNQAASESPKKRDFFDVILGNNNQPRQPIDLDRLESLVARLDIMTSSLQEMDQRQAQDEGKQKKYSRLESKKIESLRSELNLLKEKYNLQERRLQDSQAKLAEHEANKKSLEQELRQTIKERDTVKSEMDVYKKKEQELNALSDDLRRQTLQLSAEINSKASQMKVMQQDNDRFQSKANSDIGLLKAKLALANEKLSDVNGRYQDLKSQLNEIAVISEQKDEQIADKEKQISLLKEKNQKITEELNQLKQFLSKAQQAQLELSQGLTDILSEKPVIKNNKPQTESKPVVSSEKTVKDPYSQQAEELKKKVEVILQDAGE